MTDDLHWPTYAHPSDLDRVEETPLERRGLPESVYAIIQQAAQAQPDAVAHLTLRNGSAWEDPVPRTYQQLHAEVLADANVLCGLGVGRHDTVALLSVNTAELIPALLAAETVAIAAPINPALSEHDICTLLERSGARVLVAAGPELQPEVWARARRLAEALGLTALLALRPTGARGMAPGLDPLPATRVAHLADLATTESATTLRVPPPKRDDLAALFHTGGTTGTPKLAGHTHRMQVVDAWAVAAGSPPAPDAAFFAALPLFHVNALIVTTLAPAMRQQPVVWAGPLGYRDPELLSAFWRIIERYRIAVMSGVPTIYNALTAIPIDADIVTLELPVVGAAPLPEAVADRWLAHVGVPLCEGYGLTEATCASARNFPAAVRRGTVGQRLPYQEVRAARIDDGQEEWTLLGADEVGTIVLRGPVVFPGYVAGHSKTGPTLDPGTKVRGGWLDTGDLGSVAEDGYIRLVGRARDVIIRGGHNIDPLPVEQVLLQHPAVSDAGVVGRPDQRSGEVPVAYVTLAEPSADLAAIQAWARSRVAEPAAAPVAVTALPQLPVTSIGKPDKLALRVLATGAELAEALAACGCSLPADGSWCTAQDGVVTVTLAPPADPAQQEQVRDLLARYAIAWHWLQRT
jgi:fatty-acyl-CoA synthase